MPWYEGSCRITVIGVAASWPQRVVVSIRRGATIEIPGTVGASQVIDAGDASHGWDLSVEHQYEGLWRPNVRAIQGKWTDTEHGRSQLIRSKDHDWPGDTGERNLVIRIDRIGSGGPAPGLVAGVRRSRTEPAAVPVERQTAARRPVTESTSAPVWERGGAGWRATESAPAAERSPASAPRTVTESSTAPERTPGAAPRVATQSHSAPAVPRVATSGGTNG
ncbi:hypothetical protein OG500_36585 [Kitasatospora sp. NBC_01250]|uniref:hypothetical protein n=1 Tax=unclassified Kitasatospora TaxID=2633591 RepID=UPI002E149044|nr:MULTISPECIES: hypothetical protein [unclassified Kitasatospora]WSJ71484.1 hypothetical protein OG294_38280 [Kitasatospora sp. NBC_01302]